MAYDVSTVLPVEELEPGTSLLVTGPPLTRKRELMLRILASRTDEEGAVMVTTKTGAGKLLATFRDLGGKQDRGNVRTVDCVTKERGLGEVRETETTRYLNSARDMTGLSITLSGLFREFYNADVRTRFGFHSLSTFLMYHDLQRVYRMVHVLSGQIESADWIGVFVVDSPSDREQELLSQLVDGVVQTRETDEGCEYRLRGLGGRSAGWQDY